MVKRLPAMQETRVQSLGLEDPLKKEMAIHSSTLAWKIPWMEEPGRRQSMGLQRVGHNWAISSSLLSLELNGLWAAKDKSLLTPDLPVVSGWQRAEMSGFLNYRWATRTAVSSPSPCLGVASRPQGLHFCVFHLSLLPQSSLWWMTTTEPLLQAPRGRSEIHLNSPATLSRRNACDPIYRWQRWGPEKWRHIPGILGRHGGFTMFPGGLIFAGAFIIFCGCWVWSLQGEVHSWGFLCWLSPCSGCGLTLTLTAVV